MGVGRLGVRRARCDRIAKVTNKNDDSTPATVPAGVDACTALADPANANLHPSDWRRIGHWSQSEMVAYVTVHCPDELAKVGG